MTTNGNGRTFLSGVGLNLPTVIQIVTFIAIIYGQWSLLDKQVSDEAARGERRDQRTERLEDRVTVLEREMATAAVRFDNLREVVVELRRQSRVRTVP